MGGSSALDGIAERNGTCSATELMGALAGTKDPSSARRELGPWAGADAGLPRLYVNVGTGKLVLLAGGNSRSC